RCPVNPLGHASYFPNICLSPPQDRSTTGSTMQSRPIPGTAVHGSDGIQSGDSAVSPYDPTWQDFGSSSTEWKSFNPSIPRAESNPYQLFCSRAPNPPQP